MIGLIRFDFRRRIAEAVLGADGCWSCAAVPCLVHPLDILYSTNWAGLPAGPRYLEAAGRWLKGTLVSGDGCPIPGVARRSATVPVEIGPEARGCRLVSCRGKGVLPGLRISPDPSACVGNEGSPFCGPFRVTGPTVTMRVRSIVRLLPRAMCHVGDP